MQEEPPIQLLDQLLSHHEWEDLPLHAQVRRGLGDLIDRYFEDGQKFWPEALLIERLNVSQITVRRALSDLSQAGQLERRIAKGTFVRKPQQAATALSTIGVFVPQYNSAFLNEVLENVAAACWEKGLRLRVYHTQKGAKTADALRQLELPPSEEALILLAQTPPSMRDLAGALNRKGYQSLALDTLVPGVPVSYVGTDFSVGIQIGLDHLCGLGHRRIVLLVNEPEETGTIRAAVAAFQGQAKRRGLVDGKVVHSGAHFWDDSYEIAYRSMSDLWKVDKPPSAIFATSDPGAWAALKWLSEHKIRVPEDVSVLGFSNDAPSRFTLPALSTVAHPVSALARRAIEMLENREAAQVFLPPTLVVRQSTAPVLIQSMPYSDVEPVGAIMQRSS